VSDGPPDPDALARTAAQSIADRMGIAEHHVAIAPAELGFDNNGPTALQAYEFHGGSRLKLLSVFEILNRPRISGIQ